VTAAATAHSRNAPVCFEGRLAYNAAGHGAGARHLPAAGSLRVLSTRGLRSLTKLRVTHGPHRRQVVMAQESHNKLTVLAWSHETYVKWRRGFHGKYSGQRNSRAVFRMARTYLGRRILDAGCGDGSMLKEIRRRLPKADAIGLDVEANKEMGIVAGDLLRLPFESGTFDSVLSMDVLEHMPADSVGAALREIHRVLKPGGYLCMTTPKDEDLRAALVICPECHTWSHPVGHTQSFSAESIRELLVREGFGNVRIRSYGVHLYHYLGALAPVSRLLGRRLFPGLPWDDTFFIAAQSLVDG